MKVVMDWMYASYEKDKIGLPRKYETYKQLTVLTQTTTRKSLTLHPGVSFCVPQQRWRAHIYPTHVEGVNKPIYVGAYHTLEEAIQARAQKIEDLQLKVSSNMLACPLYQSKDLE